LINYESFYIITIIVFNYLLHFKDNRYIFIQSVFSIIFLYFYFYYLNTHLFMQQFLTNNYSFKIFIKDISSLFVLSSLFYYITTMFFKSKIKKLFFSSFLSLTVFFMFFNINMDKFILFYKDNKIHNIPSLQKKLKNTKYLIRLTFEKNSIFNKVYFISDNKLEKYKNKIQLLFKQLQNFHPNNKINLILTDKTIGEKTINGISFYRYNVIVFNLNSKYIINSKKEKQLATIVLHEYSHIQDFKTSKNKERKQIINILKKYIDTSVFDKKDLKYLLNDYEIIARLGEIIISEKEHIPNVILDDYDEIINTKFLNKYFNFKYIDKKDKLKLYDYVNKYIYHLN